MLYKLLGYTIYFWSGDAGEPVHVHVCKGRPTENATKIWVGERAVKTAAGGALFVCADIFRTIF